LCCSVKMLTNRVVSVKFNATVCSSQVV
jgi:hypothetical protein